MPTYADIQYFQNQILFPYQVNREINIIAVQLADKEKLLEEYANYESYRPDSFGDATRNPFYPKRYKLEDLKAN